MHAFEWAWSLALLTVPLFWAWAAIHELSHVAVAALAGPVAAWSVNLVPHRDEDGWRWASSMWTWRRVPSLRRIGLVFLAPRGPDLLAAGLLPAGPLLHLPAWAAIAWALVFGAGLADLAVGSVGWTVSSDLRRASTALDWSHWVLRVAGFAILLGSAGAWLALTLRG